ncbi:MAG: helical backbone metal receptor [Balneolaceae bacterium]
MGLGLEESLAGRTRFCIHPEHKINRIPIIGGTKNPRIDKIKDLRPDLILANREENRKEEIQKQEKDFNFMVSSPSVKKDE